MRRFNHKSLTAFAVLFIPLFCGPIAMPAQQESGPVKPSIQISFSKQTIRENDQVAIHVWVANEGDQNLTSLSLHVAGPSFLKWHAHNCSGESFHQTQHLGPVPANNIKSFDLCIKSSSTILVGDFNTSFTFEYTWQRGAKSGRSFITIEKTLKATLLGSDTVAGVPLALGGYVIPGLLFWLVLSFFWKPPWTIGVGLGEKMIYSILVSVGVIVIAGLLSYALVSIGLTGALGWSDYFDVSTGISVMKLLVLSFAGAFLGAAVGMIDAWNRESKKKELLITPADDTYTKIEKLLKLNPDFTALVKWQPKYCPKTDVSFKTSGEYSCSLYAKSGNATWLFGWFEISPDARLPDVTRDLIDFEAKGNLLELVQMARKHKLQIKGRNGIDKIASGTASPTGDSEMQILEDQIVNSSTDEDKGKGKLIELKQ